MNKNSIKKFAVNARRELISGITQSAMQYGITQEERTPASATTVNGKILSSMELNQRKVLIEQMNAKGFEQIIEETACTWFIRFCVLRYMEVNNCLPSRVRIFTNEKNEFIPQIIDKAPDLEIEGLNHDTVIRLKQSDNTEELYKYLIITQCNALGDVLPGIFKKNNDCNDILFPDFILREGGIIHSLVNDIPEDNWHNIEIIGWLYQFYIAEKHDKIINIYKGTVKKDDIPAATQLFTPDWVVKYIVDNSLGRYWVERNKESSLAKKMNFFVTPKNGRISFVDETTELKNIKVLDPCMGSGHILVYAFELLMHIYKERGFGEEEAAKSIVENNLFGLDIDKTASQLAYFSVMMKACQYNRCILGSGITPNVIEIKDSASISDEIIHYASFGNEKAEREFRLLCDTFSDAKELGSIIVMPEIDIALLESCIKKLEDEDISSLDSLVYRKLATEKLAPIVRQARIMSQKYDVVVTNPPYLNKMDTVLKEYVNHHFKSYSGDLFSVFIYRNFSYCKENGYSGFMTPFVWMFIKAYENLRRYIIETKSVITLIQMEYSAYEDATVPVCTFVLKNSESPANGLYFRLSEFRGGMEVQKKKVLEAIKDKNCGYFYESNKNNFSKIPGSPVAYWASNKISDTFQKGTPLGEKALVRNGMKTGDNERFVRLWWEIQNIKLNSNADNAEEAYASGSKWFPYNKGGEYRKWYGNNDYVVNWENSGHSVIGMAKAEKRNVQDYPNKLKFTPSVTWSLITSSKPAFRFKQNSISDIAGMSFYINNDLLYYYLAFCNSKIALEILKILAPTINFQSGDIARLPMLSDDNSKESIDKKCSENIILSKKDWDSFETSWDFKKHPLVCGSSSLLADRFKDWENECNSRFNQLKANEEELNRIFIDIYGLQDELTHDVEDKDVTVRKANLQRDIKSLISYAVGCMFGRYSLDTEGLAFAGGEWDSSKYQTYIPDKDNILPIYDNDYLDDDIVGRFIKFISVVYGEETLEENLAFIADALGGKGAPRNVIRKYFINDFYTDHLKTYQKRPIYWMFDSGKKNGFKALVYMHRYQPDTIERMRTYYVHKLQNRYRTAVSDLETRVQNADATEAIRLQLLLNNFNEKAAETQIFEKKIHHLADQMINIDPDDGVKHNYEIFRDALAKIK